MIETSKVQRATTHSVSMALDGVEDTFDTQYGSSWQIRPDYLMFSWQFIPDRGWVLMRARVTGFAMKNDGTLGKRRGSRDFERDGELDSTTPSWLRDLAGLYKPSGVVLVP